MDAKPGRRRAEAGQWACREMKLGGGSGDHQSRRKGRTNEIIVEMSEMCLRASLSPFHGSPCSTRPDTFFCDRGFLSLTALLFFKCGTECSEIRGTIHHRNRRLHCSPPPISHRTRRENSPRIDQKRFFRSGMRTRLSPAFDDNVLNPTLVPTETKCDILACSQCCHLCLHLPRQCGSRKPTYMFRRPRQPVDLLEL